MRGEMVNISSYLENANENRDVLSLQHFEFITVKILTESNAGEDLEKMDFSYIACEDVKWYSHFGKHLDSVLQS